MKPTRYDLGNIDIAWCPGCGNYSILNILKNALDELDISPENLVLVSGIGQAAKIPHYLKSNVFNGLHGRSIPPATGIKASNRNLVVIAESGDGCMYGEGGNHLLHAIRRNPDITVVIHNNMIYGLTKGQASPTSQIGFKTKIQKDGVSSEPFNAVALAISLNASFVSRAFSGDIDKSKEILKKAINHKGLSIVDMMHPCVSFNKVNTFSWFRENTYYLEEDFDYTDRLKAFDRAIGKDKLALGIFYINERNAFEDNLGIYRNNDLPLFRRIPDEDKLRKLIHSFE
ncbi:MAG: 2-oxoacid ferredoxin oxidoreductase [Candidatus Coatesbacteria bacterium]|nr:2-oxoacid ferredoxin oxidoreductase [Candidatus Coatesbacteria bacterium]